MRGTAFSAVTSAHKIRITPAHAGNSGIPSKTKFSAQDHPRACGEQVLENLVLFVAVGSPPRMRGTA